ncbi:LysR family transcriptional regulator [Weissella viridescens]|uniref:LysR family transcriptional regulator n=1 Tax=Weissella viridescens TaxID=1629 RepID=A0A0R2HAI1_WEIVI|nr:LysR family transcriptional regulator [Weissella viridescens]KRN46493.1 LysR family transcriptional regulator [Weissella viridescens]GEA94870.1 LysR family transcriptional regulator [Weissella viridescens]
MFNLLQTFLTVYETRNFTQAAEQLFISQPTVTTHIQKLEHELQAELFIRENKRVMPTAVADQFYPQAQQMLAEWRTTKQSLSHVAQQRTQVVIGASHSAATTLLPQVVNLLADYLDQVDLSVRMLNSEQVFDGMLQHKIQIGIIEKPLSDQCIASFQLADDHLVHAGDFASPVWLMREAGSGINHFTHEYLELMHIQPQNVLEMDNNDMIVAQLKAGLGQSIISSRFVDDSVPYELLGPEFNRNFYVLNHGTESDPLVLALINRIKQHVQAFK